jgi:hypothetical protein
MTYSLSITGAQAQNPYQPKNITLDDSVVASVGDEQQAMRLHQQFGVKMPDGSTVMHVYDNERSIPGVLRIVRRV